MRTRSLPIVLAIVFAGCASLEGLTGGEEPPSVAPEAGAGTGCNDPSAPFCERGVCVDDASGARCECEIGWTGPTCSACADGSDCDATSCQPTTCPAHATCDDASGAPKCSCVAGYVASDGACVWGGVVKDPTFENTPEGSWALSGGVTIAATAAGFRDPGVVELKTSACASAGVRQTVTMPPLASAEPLALDLSGAASCALSTPFGSLPLVCSRPFSVLLGGYGVEPIARASGSVPTSERVCLGERAFAEALPIEIFATSCSSTTKTVTLDHFSFVPAPDCPAPGQIANGDFEGVGGWTASAGADVATGVGSQSSRGGRLRRTERCGAAPTLTGALSVPLATPARPALTFTFNGTAGRTMSVSANRSPLGTVTGKAVFEKVSLCLPEHLRGMAGALAFALDDDGPGACGDPDASEFVFDDLAIEDDATCPAAPALLIDGGFERSDVSRYWAQDKDGGSVSFPKSTAARSGDAYARVTQSACSKTTSLRTTVSFPPASPGAGGPAIEFYYKATTASEMTYLGAGRDLAPASDWTHVRVCQPPRRAGFAASVSFTTSAGSDCQSGTLSIDDVRVFQDPTCPEP